MLTAPWISPSDHKGETKTLTICFFYFFAFFFPSLTCYETVLPPFPTKGLTAADVDDLIARVREAMMAELVRLSSDGDGDVAVDMGSGDR